jgi:predicted lipoprotein with Yx(FWY)xxD motif
MPTRRLKRHLAASAAVAAAVLGLAACGGGNGSTSTSSSATTSPPAAAPTNDTVQARTTSLGSVLATANGHTLYLFMKDAGGKSACSGTCAQTWPPLTASGSPTAGAGADASKLGTVARDDGTMQVTYAGSPLYLYSKDDGAGDTYGQGVGGVWFAAGPDGKPIASKAAATTTSVRSSSY